jgi:hypothetical protein
MQMKKYLGGEERQTVKQKDGEAVAEGEVGEGVTLKVGIRGRLNALRPQSVRCAVVVAWMGG